MALSYTAKVVALSLLLLAAPATSEYSFQDVYKFSYAVDDGYSGNQFGHTENRFGVETVGTYHVLLPDGRLQTVSYTVDPLYGYKATVGYQGSPSAAAAIAAPAYSPPPVQPAFYKPPEYNAPAAQYQPRYDSPAYHPPPPPPQQIYSDYTLGYAYGPRQLAPPVPAYSANDYAFPAPPPSDYSYAYKPRSFSPSFQAPPPGHFSDHSLVVTPVLPAAASAAQSFKQVTSAPQAAPVPETSTPSSEAAPPADIEEVVIKSLKTLPTYGVPTFYDSYYNEKESNDVGGPVLPSFTPAPDTARQVANNKGPDPYLLSDAELAGKDFSSPYFYPRDRKIIKKARKE